MTPILSHILLVSIGAFFGAIMRYVIGRLFNKRNFPVGTLIVNLVGAYLLGVIYGSGMGHTQILVFGTGFMGSFTTFSTLKIEHIELTLKKKWKTLVSYSLLTYGGGLLLAWIGFNLTR